MESEAKTKFKKFTKGYTFKMFFLFFLVLILLIPLKMVDSLIWERSKTADSAEADIMEAWGSELVAAGPVIAIPGIRTEEIRTRTERDGEKVDIIKNPFTLIMVPQKLNIATNFKTEIRKRGIFFFFFFYGDLAISGTFEPAQALSSLLPNEEISFNKAELIISLSSQKGIRKIDQAIWNAQGDDVTLFFQPGNRGQNFASKVKSLDLKYKYNYKSGGGIYAALPELTADTKPNFNVVITIHGGRLVRFLPFGQDTHTDIAADWSSPSFQGSFLPGNSNIKDDSFDATWDINYLSRDIPLYWKTTSSGSDYSDALFGVNFFRAIDTYSLNTRAVKYAILFLVVPFLTLFLFEILTKKRIHPVPYLLSGIANIIFYLLLLSLSEQIQFYLAYLIAAIATIIMLTLYSRTLLPSWNKSWYMGLVITASYVLLYAVLNAESYALLIGSVWAFAVVALVMFLTRKLNWYGSDE
jgi:inner membrane protein